MGLINPYSIGTIAGAVLIYKGHTWLGWGVIGVTALLVYKKVNDAYQQAYSDQSAADYNSMIAPLIGGGSS